MAITAIRHGITLDELDAWGSVADLGSEILEGEVKAFGKMTAGAPTDPVSAAYFGTTAGKFRMTYPFSEQATVVSGEVRLTDESTGQSTLYKAGDSWFVSQGTPVLCVGWWSYWRMPKEGRNGWRPWGTKGCSI
ncbi:cupin domain-containing protein [Pseudomonas aeruginosa]|uniref:cupin domain-containing protein n=1 Tax=Pseudomonas aeruginosa TaxID=287 RepID=UPI0039C2B57D